MRSLYEVCAERVDDSSVGQFLTYELCHIILHNYDIYVESVKKAGYIDIDQPAHSIITAQTDFSYTPESDWIYKAICDQGESFGNGHPDYCNMTTNMVMERNRLRGLRCVEKRAVIQPTPLQAELLKLHASSYLTMFIFIHPYLLLDKKFKVKGDKRVLDRGRGITLRNSISCAYCVKTAHSAVATVQRLKRVILFLIFRLLFA